MKMVAEGKASFSFRESIRQEGKILKFIPYKEMWYCCACKEELITKAKCYVNIYHMFFMKISSTFS